MQAFHLRPRARKTVLTAHVAGSVGWLGATLVALVLAVVGVTSTDPPQQHAVYQVLALIGPFVVTPLSLLALVTGLMLSLGTRWGLLRYRWVTLKFGLTVITVLATQFALLPKLSRAAETVTVTGPGRLAELGGTGRDILVACCVSFTTYLVMVGLSVFKPSGRRL